jgi:uncharacterized membrane protein YvlD (DUF360 family)
MFIVLNILVTAVVLQILATVTSNLQIDDWAAAFKLGIALAVVGYVVAFLWGLVPEDARKFQWWQFVAFTLALNTIVLGVTSLVVTGVRFRGFGTFIVASVLVTAADFAVPFLVAKALLSVM